MWIFINFIKTFPYTDIISENTLQLLLRVKSVIENYENNVLKNRFEAYEERNEENWLVIRATWPDNGNKLDIQFPITR